SAAGHPVLGPYSSRPRHSALRIQQRADHPRCGTRSQRADRAAGAAIAGLARRDLVLALSLPHDEQFDATASRGGHGRAILDTWLWHARRLDSRIDRRFVWVLSHL